MRAAQYGLSFSAGLVGLVGALTAEAAGFGARLVAEATGDAPAACEESAVAGADAAGACCIGVEGVGADADAGAAAAAGFAA